MHDPYRDALSPSVLQYRSDAESIPAHGLTHNPETVVTLGSEPDVRLTDSAVLSTAFWVMIHLRHTTHQTHLLSTDRTARRYETPAESQSAYRSYRGYRAPPNVVVVSRSDSKMAIFFFMIRQPTKSTLILTLFPYSTLFCL